MTLWQEVDPPASVARDMWRRWCEQLAGVDHLNSLMGQLEGVFKERGPLAMGLGVQGVDLKVDPWRAEEYREREGETGA